MTTDRPTTAAGRRIDAAFAAAAARGDTSASWEDARSWILAIEAEAAEDAVERIRARFNFDPCHECDNADTAHQALDAEEAQR